MSDPLGTAAPLTGDHGLPALIGARADQRAGAPSPRPPIAAPAAPRRLSGILVPVGAALAAVAALGGMQLWTSFGYDAAEEDLDVASHVQEAATSALRGSLDDAALVADAAARIVAESSGSVLDTGALEPLREGGTALRPILADAELLAAESAPTADDKPIWAWELIGAAEALRERTAVAERTAKAMGVSAEALDEAAAQLEVTGAELFAAAVGRVPQLEAAALSARNETILELRAAGEELDGMAEFLGPESAQAFIELDAAAYVAASSFRAELAAKAGPLQETRLEVEAFARSLAPGVLMDFAWSPLVNGIGADGWLSGQAWWHYDRGGYASLELSDSVAEQWPGQSARSLVAHEVGHAITVKCPGLYDDTDQAAIEEWATAWAHSMGFTDAANGTSAYGPPSQAMIDLAATCR